MANLSELEVIAPLPDNGAVIGLHFSSDTGILQAVYEALGTLVQWDLHSGTIVSRRDLGISTAKSLRFDGSGSFLLGAMTFAPGSRNEPSVDGYLSGVNIWDTATGRSIYCVVRPCGDTARDSASNQYPSLTIGADMDGEGAWALDFSSTAISFDDLQGSTPGQTLLLEDPDHSLRVANVALEPSGNRYAIAFRQGLVTVRRRWIDPLASLFEFDLSADGNDDGAVPDMRFSYDGRYLAVLMGERLDVWKLGPLSGRRVIGETIPGARLLQFNTTNDLLAVATSESIVLFDIQKAAPAASILTPALTSMAFDAANRVLLWGDSQGGIHVIQVGSTSS